MWEQKFRKIISGKNRGVGAALIRGLLRALTPVYAAASAIRNIAFDLGLKRTQHVDNPVIAIGNLTTGGTGKTPLVACVVRMVQDAGRKPGIVSRGYRADESGQNDEKQVLEKLCPEVPHEQNPDRVTAARRLLDTKVADVLVLDDAFQHRRIGRDLNVVLIDATNPFGYGHLLPRGLLRESVSGLRRADIVIITRTDSATTDVLESTERTVIANNPDLQGRILRTTFQPTCLASQDGTRSELSGITNKPVFVMTAIGNPDAFVQTCEQLGANIVGTRFFPDHHHYSKQEVDDVIQQADQTGASVVLTTLKDLVKIPPGHENIRAVLIETVFESEAHEQILRDEVARATKINAHGSG